MDRDDLRVEDAQVDEARPVRSRSARRIAGQVLAGFVLALAASTSWARAFGADWYVVGVLASCVGAVAGAIALSVRRRLLAAVAAVVALWVGVAALAAAPASDPAVWVTVPWDGLVAGWRQLLSLPLPLPNERAFYVLPVTLVALVALIGAVTFGRRTRPLAFATALAVWFAGLMLGVGGYGSVSRVVVPLVVLLLAVLLVAAVVAGDRGLAVVDRVVKGLALGLVALLVASIVGPNVSSAFGRATPYDPRDVVVPPTTLQTLPNPLDSLGAQLKSTGATNAEVFTVRVSGAGAAKPSTYWEVATFDRYDGVSWSTSGAATRTTVVEHDPPTVPVDRLTELVTPSSTVLPFIPHTGPVTRIDSQGLYANRAANTVVVGGAVPPTRTYVLQGQIPRPGADDLVNATGNAVPPDAVENTAPPSATCLPAAWGEPIRKAASGQSYAGSANAIVEWVRALNVEVSTTARPGSSCQRLQELANDPALATSEQLATVAVLALRTVGVTARLGYGYRVRAAAADGTYTARTNDVVAYPEIWYDGIGWMPREVAPAEATSSGAEQAVDPTQQVQDVASQQTSGDTGTGPGPGNKTDEPVTPAAGLSTAARTALGVGALLVVLALWVGVVAIVRSRRRTRARTTGDPRDRVAGAWSDVLRDTAPEASSPSPRTGSSGGRRGLTVGEASVRISERYPEVGGSVGTLATLMATATYGPHPVSENEATAAWRDRDTISAAAQRRRPRTRRLRMLVDPRL